MSTQITPNQIRPAPVSGQVVGTIAGTTKNITLVPGTGIDISIVGDTIVISASGVPFNITSFVAITQLVELGTTVNNPAFTATYNATPDSANITNTDGAGSPKTLTTPFTSGTVTASFVRSVQALINFTLNATKGTVTKTSTQGIQWSPAIFGGVGAAAATSSVTASGSNAILSNGASLGRAQLGVETTGEVFGPYSPSGQSIYLLLINSTHTFSDSTTGFPIPFNTPTAVSFVNSNGVSVAMYLYESTNTLFGTYRPKVIT